MKLIFLGNFRPFLPSKMSYRYSLVLYTCIETFHKVVCLPTRSWWNVTALSMHINRVYSIKNKMLPAHISIDISGYCYTKHTIANAYTLHIRICLAIKWISLWAFRYRYRWRDKMKVKREKWMQRKRKITVGIQIGKRHIVKWENAMKSVIITMIRSKRP